jgi:predicted SAM-dependent methyltransferase
MNLNLGAGPIRLPGEIGVDLDPGAAGCDVAANLLALPFADGSIAQCRLSHVLEHFPYRMAPTVLLEVARVLAPGGTLIVGVPDMEGTCRAWLEACALPSPESLSGKAIVLRHMFGSQAHDGQEHLGAFDTETLGDLLRCCGFVDVDVREDTERGDLIETLIATAVRA